MPLDAPVVVIGAGAAGLVAAIFARRGARRVVLVERTRDGGRKILISGGGRCNILPSVSEPSRFVTDSSPNTLRNLLCSWPLADQQRFFSEEVGIPLVLEAATGKLFPASHRARDVRDGLVALAQHEGVEARFNTCVSGLAAEEGGFRIDVAGGDSLKAAKVVVATGGLSVPNTGSDGLGLKLVARLGHTIHATYPALTPLVAEPARHAELAGVSLPVTLRAPQVKTETRGGFLFTHRGYSGPAVLDISHVATRSRLTGGDRQAIFVQWGEHQASAWDQWLCAEPGPVVAVVRRRLPQRLAATLCREAGLAPDLSTAHLSRAGRMALIGTLTRYLLPWTGDEGYKKAEVTGGGVALHEIHPKTLESKLRPGLFLCGELLDAFGPIGGHNFAWAWATGRAAGTAAAQAVAIQRGHG